MKTYVHFNPDGKIHSIVTVDTPHGVHAGWTSSQVCRWPRSTPQSSRLRRRIRCGQDSGPDAGVPRFGAGGSESHAEEGEVARNDQYTSGDKVGTPVDQKGVDSLSCSEAPPKPPRHGQHPQPR
jgi:hypothetical protein